MDDKEKVIKMRDLFLETAYILDELIELNKKEEDGEDIGSQGEATIGRLMYKMVELQALM